jgi:hypothetical protein
MKRVLFNSNWTLLIEDPDKNEISLQSLCGGVAMYWMRIVLTPEEVEEFGSGSLDIRGLSYELCKETSAIKDRIVPPFEGADLPW